MKMTADKSNPHITDRHHGAISVLAAIVTASIKKKAINRGGASRLPILNLRVMAQEPRSEPLFPESNDMAWVWLIVGGLFEVGFTTSLRFVDGFRNLNWTIAFLVSVAISMALLEFSSRSIPMGTAYAVWGGIGAVGTVAVGMLWFQEPASAVRILLILAIVAAIAALRITS
jgi:quaternary ammonium compound-resistance protein SugE